MFGIKSRFGAPMGQYYDLLQDVMENGHDSDDRTGVGTRKMFGKQIRFNLNDGFPLLTGKLVPFKLVAAELLWFLSGSTDNEDLRALNQSDRPTIWEEWQYKGELGPIYSQQWRNWENPHYGENVDQIEALMDGLVRNPFSRRHIVSAWNVNDLPDESVSPQQNVAEGKMSLAPCHAFVQFGVRKLTRGERLQLEYKMKVVKSRGISESVYWGSDSKTYDAKLDELGIPKLALSCHLTQRSADMFLGVPFNIASYALLTEMIAHVTGMVANELVISFGDVHIYKNHFDQVNELLDRRSSAPGLPTLEFTKKFESIDDFSSVNDFRVVGYKPFSAISAPVAV